MAERFWASVALQPQALNPRLRSTLRRSFFAYAGLLLLIGWAYAGWYIVESRARTEILAGEQLLAVADSLNAQMEAMLGDGLGSAESAWNNLRKGGPMAELPTEYVIERLRDEVTGNYIRALFVGNPKRTIVGGKGVAEETQGVPSWLTEVPGDRQTLVSPPIPDPSRPGRSVIPLTRGVMSETQGLVWFGMWFDVEELLGRYQNIDIDEGAISVLRADGWLLMGTAAPGRAAPTLRDLRGSEVFARIKTLPAGRASVLDGVSALDGKRKLFAVAKASDNVPLNLVVTRHYDAIIAPWERSTRAVVWLAVGLSALLIVMTMLLYRFLHEINRRESQFQKLFENALSSVLLVKEGRIVEQNSQAVKMFRIPANRTLVGRTIEEMSADIQPDGTPSCEAIARHRERLSREGGALFDWQFKRADTGEPFETEVSLSTIQVASDAVILALVRDISEQEAAKRELRKMNLQLEARVTQRTAELQRTNAQLAATNRALEEFTASVSHDLRSPLSSISGQAGLLELTFGEQLGIKGKERLTRIQQAVQRASDVVGGLLSLARIARQEVQVEAVSLSEIAQAVIEELRESDPERELDVAIEPEMTVRADRGLMTSLIANLIGNAWKYSGKRPRVWIRFDRRERGNDVVYCIADHGSGFSMDHAAGLFQAFRRLHSTAEFSGVGLGLATVERIVARYGGEIWAEAEPEVGAKFFFTLPNAQEPGVLADVSSF